MQERLGGRCACEFGCAAKRAALVHSFLYLFIYLFQQMTKENIPSPQSQYRGTYLEDFLKNEHFLLSFSIMPLCDFRKK